MLHLAFCGFCQALLPRKVKMYGLLLGGFLFHRMNFSVRQKHVTVTLQTVPCWTAARSVSMSSIWQLTAWTEKRLRLFWGGSVKHVTGRCQTRHLHETSGFIDLWHRSHPFLCSMFRVNLHSSQASVPFIYTNNVALLCGYVCGGYQAVMHESTFLAVLFLWIVCRDVSLKYFAPHDLCFFTLRWLL